MRITGGQHKGRPLKAPKGLQTRPTSDRARESLFSILSAAGWAPPLEGARVLDLFAGSGALGFEAMSRGAAFALFVDIAASARGAIRDNAQSLGLTGSIRLHRRPADALGQRPNGLGAPFSVVFMDPPYGQGLAERVLAALPGKGWLAPGAVVFAETEAALTPEPRGWTLLDTRTQGGSRLSFLSPPAQPA